MYENNEKEKVTSKSDYIRIILRNLKLQNVNPWFIRPYRLNLGQLGVSL